MESIQKINDILSDANIKASFQRIKIFEFLMNNNIHPTVDIIYSKLINQIPTLSKTTVYNTLKLFKNHGVIKSVSIDDNEIRYDAIMSIHGHFKCQKCNKIYDFEYNNTDLKYSGLSNYQIKQTELNLKGICPKCI